MKYLFTTSIAFLIVAMSAAAQHESGRSRVPQASDKEARSILRQFDRSVRKAGTEKQLLEALQKLGEKRHARILKKLTSWVKGQEGLTRRVVILEIRSKGRSQSRSQRDLHVKRATDRAVQEARAIAISKLAGYRDSPAAARTLLRYASALVIKNERDPKLEQKVEIISLAALIGGKDIARDLCKLFWKQEVLVSKEAITATTRIGTKECITALILLISQLEGIRENTGVGDEGMIPNRAGSGKAKGIARRHMLYNPAVGALREITGQRFRLSSDWKLWWATNRKHFSGKN